MMQNRKIFPIAPKQLVSFMDGKNIFKKSYRCPSSIKKNKSLSTTYLIFRFQLQSVDAGFYDFLSDLGVPWFAISILKRMSETMDLLPPQNLTHGTWRWTIDRGK